MERRSSPEVIGALEGSEMCQNRESEAESTKGAIITKIQDKKLNFLQAICFQAFYNDVRKMNHVQYEIFAYCYPPSHSQFSVQQFFETILCVRHCTRFRGLLSQTIS